MSALIDGDWFAAIEPGREYYSRRTPGWDWNGVERWWEVFVVFADGFHGGGGACITELWRWNGSTQVLRREPRDLTYAESVELVTRLTASPDGSLVPAKGAK